MTEEIKTVEETPISTENKAEAKKNDSVRRGERGEVGPHNLKGLFHSFQRREGRKSRGVSLKAFAHNIAEQGTDEEKAIALAWIKNKS